jgi:uncharacterized membrane protein
MDLTAIIALALLLVPLALLTEGPLRIVLGLLFLLFFPGYVLIAALFPRRDSLDTIERVILSFAVSIAFVPLTGVALNYTTWGITSQSVVVTASVFIVLGSAVALYRRLRLAKDERFDIRPHVGRPQPGQWSKLNVVLSALLVLAVLGTIGIVVYTVNAARSGDKFTEFYVLSTEGTVKGLPEKLTVGRPGEVILGIENHEHETTTYRIEIWIAGKKIQDVGPVIVDDGEEWEEKIAFVPTAVGTNQEVDFRLRKGDASELYREVRLWVDVERS